MPNYNKLTLIGHLTRDPELITTANGKSLCKTGIAVNNKVMNKVMFIDCVSFGKTGEALNEYCQKGDAMLFEGELTLNQWETQGGQKHSKHEMSVFKMEFIKTRGNQAKPQEQHSNDGYDGGGIPF